MSDVEPQSEQPEDEAARDEANAEGVSAASAADQPDADTGVDEAPAEAEASSMPESEASQMGEGDGPPASEDEPAAETSEGPPLPTAPGMGWYVLRVASNKEEQVRDALERKVKIEGLEDRIGRILVPMVKEKTIRRGQARIVQRKLYAGYVFVEMATESDGSIPENVWFLVKETTGVGDFIQSDGRPTSMKDSEVERMLAAVTQPEDEAALSSVKFRPGDRVKIREGPFENFEGDVEAVDDQKGMVTVLLMVFGRQSPVDVEYWNLESI
jgi:transcriptional antiterminator NusG